jgi:hypothetical protein
MTMIEKTPLNATSGAGGIGSMPADEPNGRRDPAAERALAEAQARRAEIARTSKERPKELHGRNGPDPTRYGDWEVNGIANDF